MIQPTVYRNVRFDSISSNRKIPPLFSVALMMILALALPRIAESQEGGVLSDERLAMGSNWVTPVRGNYPVLCGSGSHGGKFQFSVDIATPVGVEVRAATAGRVIYSGNDTNGPNEDFGELILIDSVKIPPSGVRTYRHAYAHLSQRNVASGTFVNRGELLGLTGDTGNTSGPHLHFHVSAGESAVDPTPMVGFDPFSNFPTNDETTCGKNYDPANTAERPLLVVEPAIYLGKAKAIIHDWVCRDGGETNECFMETEPNLGSNYNPSPNESVNPSGSSPELEYLIHVPQAGEYEILLCGRSDDVDALPSPGSNHGTLHVGTRENNVPILKKEGMALTGWSNTGFGWGTSTRHFVSPPRIHLEQGESRLLIWMGQDGTAVSRVLLSRLRDGDIPLPRPFGGGPRCGLGRYIETSTLMTVLGETTR